VGALDPSRHEEARAWAELDGVLAELARIARAAWPGISVDDLRFAAYLAERVPAGQPLSSALAAMHGADLGLACACALGDDFAIRTFETTYAADIDAACRRFRHGAQRADELRQVLRMRLFLGSEGSPPRILRYSGQGDLRYWVRVVAVRLFMNVARAEREVPTDDEALASMMTPPGFDTREHSEIRARYAGDLKAAFAAATQELSFRDRNVLRYAFVDQRTIDQIGEIYGVHRATAARWVTKAKESFADRFRSRLAERLGLSSSELASVVIAALSGFEASFSRLVRR
jgi:RNA polymerase sigma-70 factor (ECF subfamily)